VHQAVSKKRPKSPKLDIPFDCFQVFVVIISSCEASYGPDTSSGFDSKIGITTEIPRCATTYQELNDDIDLMCLDDDDYPVFDIENALFYHYYSVAAMYKVSI
jgi:hypothetical protein